ncbi:dienelactone hydrolase family protein [Sphingomonas sp. BIUV-7]|uniref:Dienelactone hydrolase family protein n=1 Tax=Sphingomonas natans TaxID=3063330 RepID=A0ABT8YD05_9SPHN|nr:dienelactone hydrolase family protein [Sphingomonas sp. BIUV-7]MDO6415827.1 dienelactone hydrolase family protein [Sphingomonas sp. BIUV-7]
MAGRPWNYRHDDLALRGELYEPVGTPNGRAVLVVHEADGIGQNVRSRCELLASLGYVAAAADMHGGGQVLAAEDIPAALDRFRSDPALVRGRVGAALEALFETTGFRPSAVAAIGYCFGGFAVLELARDGAAVAAIVSFHGILTSAAPAAAGSVRAPILAATGALDPLVPPRDVAAFEEEMRAADADWHLLTHGRAYHSFTNIGVDGLDDPRMRYDPVADAMSWAAATAFLEARLR